MSTQAILASGELQSTAAGIMEGIIDFPVRGSIKFRIERRPNDHIGECAMLYALTPQPTRANLALVSPQPADGNSADFWHGVIQVEGYSFQFRGERKRGWMAVQFLDTKQPMFVTADMMVAAAE